MAFSAPLKVISARLMIDNTPLMLIIGSQKASFNRLKDDISLL